MSFTPDHATLISRVKKLLNLARCKTAEEAASAAAMAQKLIEKYRLDAALCAEDAPEKAAPRPTKEDVVFRFAGQKADQWVCSLASSVGKVNGCYIWQSHEVSPVCDASGIARGTKIVRVIRGAGAEDSLATVAYLIGYLVHEVNRLAENVRGAGRTWLNNFRQGAVHEIGRRLRESHEAARAGAIEAARNPEKARADAYAEAAGNPEALIALDSEPVQSFALAKVEAAIVRMDGEQKAAEAYARDTHKLRTVYARSRLDSGGYEAGKRAGARVNLSNQNRRLA